ncbi:MAG: pilus assembly protein PilM [Oscillospiraceae bacterium]|nr:pilus assembly protein PilM [Oscillospiraceae bacterium]
MDTAIYFFNDLLKVVTGKVSGKSIQVKKASCVQLGEGVLINGVITDEEALKQALLRLKKEKKLIGKLRIVIDSTNILTKRCTVPMLAPKQLLKYTADEFADLSETYQDLVCDYAVLEAKAAGGQNGTIICSAAERELLQRYLDLFSEAKLKVESIDISLNSFLKAISYMPELSGKTYIFSIIENGNMTSGLFVDNVYMYSSRSRLFSPAGTEALANEILSQMSSLIQFNKSEQTKKEIEAAYFCGIDEDTLKMLAELAQSFSLRVSEMPKTKMASVQDRRIQGIPANYMIPLGCLIRKA